MDRRVWQVQEKWPVCVLTNKLDGLLRVAAREGKLLLGPDALDDLLIFNERQRGLIGALQAGLVISAIGFDLGSFGSHISRHWKRAVGVALRPVGSRPHVV